MMAINNINNRLSAILLFLATANITNVRHAFPRLPYPVWYGTRNEIAIAEISQILLVNI
jgi:hypothetical protein